MNQTKFLALTAPLALLTAMLIPSGTALALDLDTVIDNQLSFSKDKVKDESKFDSPTDRDILSEASVGDFALYEDVVTVGGQSVDALVTYTAGVNMNSDSIGDLSTCDGKLEELDDQGVDRFLSVETNADSTCTAGATESSATVTVEFQNGSTGRPVTLENVTINVYDVDSHQFVDFQGFSSYTLSMPVDDEGTLIETTIITPNDLTGGKYRFQADGTSTDTDPFSEGFFQSPDDPYTLSRVTVTYDAISSIDLVMGALTAGNGGANFDFDFSVGESWDYDGGGSLEGEPVTITAVSYEISYSLNGGQGITPTSTNGTGTQSIASGNPTRTGFDFVGWNTRADGTGTTLISGDSYTPGRDTVLYAEWETDSPTPYSGPIITDIGEDNIAAPYQTFGGQTVRVDGDRLSGVTKVFIDGKEGTVVSTADDHFVMIFPDGLTPGTYDLLVQSSIGRLTYLDGFLVTAASENFAAANVACDGVEPSWWTQRISDTEAKAYIKCPEVGQKYRILQQTGGSGSYDSIFAKTLNDENDQTQVFNEFGRYIVRTIDLEDINRIRIRVDDEELWKVRYNR